MQNEIFASATKIVLLWVMLILGVITLFAVSLGIWRASLDSKDVLAIFSSVVTFIIGYYFSKRENPPTPEGTVTSSKVSTETTTVKDNPVVEE